MRPMYQSKYKDLSKVYYLIGFTIFLSFFPSLISTTVSSLPIEFLILIPALFGLSLLYSHRDDLREFVRYEVYTGFKLYILSIVVTTVLALVAAGFLISEIQADLISKVPMSTSSIYFFDVFEVLIILVSNVIFYFSCKFFTTTAARKHISNLNNFIILGIALSVLGGIFISIHLGNYATGYLNNNLFSNYDSTLFNNLYLMAIPITLIGRLLIFYGFFLVGRFVKYEPKYFLNA